MARPKRANIEPKNYTLPPAVLIVAGDESSSSENENASNQSNTKKKKTKNINVPSDSDDSDVYDPSTAQEKGKGREERESSNSDEGEMEIDSGREEGADDGEISGVEGSDLDDDLGSDSTSNRKSTSKGQIKIRDAKKKKDPVQIIRIRAPPIVKPKASTSPGVKARARKGVSSRMKNDPVEMGFHTLYEPPIRTLNLGTSVDTSEITYTAPAKISERLNIEKCWTLFPFGPLSTDVGDLGWWKGKWNEEKMNDEWGGWSKEITLKNLEIIPESEARDYLPYQVFPSKPGKIFSKNGQNQSTPEADQEKEGSDEEDEEEEVTEIKVWLGPIGKEHASQKLVTLKLFESRRLDDFLLNKPGHIFNAGGSISGVVWLPRKDSLPNSPHPYEYAAISTIGTHPLDNVKVTSPSMIQIWSLDTSNSENLSRMTPDKVRGELNESLMKFEFGLCIESGDAWDIKWCPKGGQILEEDIINLELEEKMGIIGGVFTDGSVSLFVVPSVEQVQQSSKGKKEDRLFVHVDPILKLEIEGSRCLSFTWGSHDLIAAGCVNGHVAIWTIAEALKNGSKSVRPIQYFSIASSCIRSLLFVRVPPAGEDGINSDPDNLVITGHDGSTTFVDRRTETGTVLSHERTLVTSVAFCTWTGALLHDSAEHRVKITMIKPEDFGSSRALTLHRGLIWSITTSDFHPFSCSTSADGSCILTNTIRTAKLLKKTIYYVKKVYRLDFNRLTGEYRMIDNILPEQKPTLEIIKKAKDKVQSAFFQNAAPSGTWSPQIGITQSDWSKNFRRASLLITGMANGLGRIDWVDSGMEDPDDKEVEIIEEEDGDFMEIDKPIKVTKKKTPAKEKTPVLPQKVIAPKKKVPKIVDDEEEEELDEIIVVENVPMEAANPIEAEETPVEPVVPHYAIFGKQKAIAPPPKKVIKKPTKKKVVQEPIEEEVVVVEAEVEEKEKDPPVPAKSKSKAKPKPKPKPKPKSVPKSKKGKEVEVEPLVDDWEDEPEGSIIASPSKKKIESKKKQIKKVVATTNKAKVTKKKKQDDEMEIDEEQD